MVYWQQDKHEEAQSSLDRAVQLMEGKRPGQFSAIRLRNEAADLLGVKPVPQ